MRRWASSIYARVMTWTKLSSRWRIVGASDLGLCDPGDNPEYLNLRAARQRAEVQAVRQALAVARPNLSQAAQLLGVTRPTLYDLLQKYRIDATQFARGAATTP